MSRQLRTLRQLLLGESAPKIYRVAKVNSSQVILAGQDGPLVLQSTADVQVGDEVIVVGGKILKIRKNEVYSV